MSFLKDKIEIGIETAELKSAQTFNSFPKKIKYIFIILLVGAIPAYFIAQFAAEKIYFSKFQQNAVKAKTSFSNPKELQISDVSITNQGTNLFAAAVKITNSNLDLSFDNAAYNINFYNSEHQLIYTHSDRLFLLPNQTKYVTVPRFSLNEPIFFSDFKFSEGIHWQKRLTIPSVKLITSAPQSSEQFSPQAFVLTGDFFNNSAYGLKQVHLTFLLFDSTNKIIGVSQRDENTISAHERRAYIQTWPGFQASAVNRAEVYADTDTLDANNLSISAENPGSAGDLGRPQIEQ